MGVGSNPTSDMDPVFEFPHKKVGKASLAADSRVAQWKRAGPITQRSVDRNHALLEIFLTFSQWQRNMGPLAECWSVGVVVITSALHAEGRQFEPGRNQDYLF